MSDEKRSQAEIACESNANRISELEKNYVKLDEKYWNLVIENRNEIAEKRQYAADNSQWV